VTHFAARFPRHIIRNTHRVPRDNRPTIANAVPNAALNTALNTALNAALNAALEKSVGAFENEHNRFAIFSESPSMIVRFAGPLNPAARIYRAELSAQQTTAKFPPQIFSRRKKQIDKHERSRALHASTTRDKAWDAAFTLRTARCRAAVRRPRPQLNPDTSRGMLCNSRQPQPLQT
jgi:hypothetical protein